ncbi:hypothetical protein ACJX0J_020917, partial [Zea mays]
WDLKLTSIKVKIEIHKLNNTQQFNQTVSDKEIKMTKMKNNLNSTSFYCDLIELRGSKHIYKSKREHILRSKHQFVKLRFLGLYQNVLRWNRRAPTLENEYYITTEMGIS